ncbi:uncharacterized protein LOC144150142 [Haemaphysalis longicornis]
MCTAVLLAQCRSHSSGTLRNALVQTSSTQAARGTGRTLTNSQVLAFNVSNFAAVMFLKALLVALGFATGFSGLGLYTARREDGQQDFTFELPMPPVRPPAQQADNGYWRWFTTYLSSLNTGDYACLRRLACEQPERARLYAGVKDTLVSALRMAPWLFSHNSAHDKITASVRSAAQIGTRNHRICRIKFPCRTIPSYS